MVYQGQELIEIILGNSNLNSSSSLNSLTKDYLTKKQSAGGFLSSIWSFSDEKDESQYRWYGTLPRGLIEKIIVNYTKEDSRILDPFMGTGVTLEVASAKGLSSTGLDTNPLACMIAEDRVSSIRKNFLTEGLEQILQYNNAFYPPRSVETGKLAEIVKDDCYRYTRKWFRDDTLQHLLSLYFHISQVKNKEVQRLFFIVAAQVTREVASVDPRCTNHFVTKIKPFINPIALFQTRIQQVLRSYSGKSNNYSHISISQGSVFDSKADSISSDLVIIHPPYLGIIHYHLIHRLATDLLDITKKAERPRSLLKYTFNYEDLKLMDVSTNSSEVYNSFIRKLSSIIRYKVSSNGKCIVIIGDQRYKNHLRHPFTDFIYQFEKSGFKLQENFIWILQNNGGLHVLRRGNFIDHNYVLVFNKS